MLILTDKDSNDLFTACAPCEGPFPPRVVTRTVASLLGTHKPENSHVIFDPGSQLEGNGHSRWRLWVTNAESLVHVDLEVAAYGYDLTEEESARWSNSAPEMTLRAAWVLPLRSITELSLTDTAWGSPSRNGKSTVFFKAITVSFEHAQDISIDFDITRTSRAEAIEMAGAFVAVLRRGLLEI